MSKKHRQHAIVVGVVERDGKFLLLRRVDNNALWHHKWNIPGGGIEPGETTAEAITREILEETGLVTKAPELLGVHTHDWELADVTIQTILLVYRLVEPQGEIVLDLVENDDHRWVSADEFVSMDPQEHLGGNLDMLEAVYRDVREAKKRNRS